MKKAVFGGIMFVLGLGAAAWLPVAGAAATEKQAARPFTVSVDPRVELMSILFRLVGNPEYSQGRVPSYVQDVDPNLKAIVVTFDRPMRDKSWAVVTFVRDQFPKISGPVGYDAAHKVFTAPVELQPGKEYLFGLNAEKFLGFCSEEGIPLAPVVVRFRTRQADK